MSGVLIIGCGYVGTALGIELSMSGFQVWGMRRDPSRLPASIQPLACDLAELSKFSLPCQPDYIFYMPSAGQYDAITYQKTYVNGVENLTKCIKFNQIKPKRLFYVSSTSVYGQSDGSWVDESTAPQPNSAMAECLLQGEQVLLQAPWPATVVRFGGIYGPERSNFIDQIKQGKMLLSPQPLYTNRIHRDDCAGLLHFLMQQPQLAELYLGVDCEPSLKNTVITWLAGELGLPVPAVESETSLPERRMRGNKRCSNQRLLAAGYDFKYPSFREGYHSLIK